MYVRTLRIQNTKLLRDFELSFLRDDKPRMWTVLIGENGSCKTTILQALAIAAVGTERSNALANVPSFPDRRLKSPPVRIDADFTFGTGGHKSRKYPGLKRGAGPPTMQVRAELKPDARYFEVASHYSSAGNGAPTAEDPLKQARLFALPHWFVAGYGVERSLPMPQQTRQPDYRAEPLVSLFGRGPIIGTGFADLFEATELVRDFAGSLRDALLAGQRLLPRVSGIELRGRGGVKQAKQIVESHRIDYRVGGQAIRIPATWLSQGYQGLIAWVADLVGHQFWERGGVVPLDEMEGLVLIDELDLFLHPTWQVTLIQALKSTFPRMQFVCTTHSPMVLAGLEQDELFVLQEDDAGNIVAQPASKPPQLMTGSEIYRAFFGIDQLYPHPLGEKLRRYGYLSGNAHRSKRDDSELTQLRLDLGRAGVVTWDPVPRGNGRD